MWYALFEADYGAFGVDRQVSRWTSDKQRKDFCSCTLCELYRRRRSDFKQAKNFMSERERMLKSLCIVEIYRRDV